MRRLVMVVLAFAFSGAGHVGKATAEAANEDTVRPEEASCHREGTWVEVQTLDADEPFARRALALNRDMLVTGGGGHVRVYRRSGANTWALAQTLTPEPGVPASAFGRGLALDEHRLLIGAGAENASGTSFPFGYADVYRRHSGLLTFEARLQPDPGAPPTCQESSFGKNVALDGDLAAVSAHRMGLGPGGCGQGAVFVFRRTGTNWAQVQALPAPQIPISNPPPGYPNFDTNFGDSMSLSGNELVVGQPGRHLNPQLQGALHVFVRTGSAFSLQQAFVAPGVAYNTADGLGVEVAIRGRTLAVEEDGKLRTFVRHAGTWTARSEAAAITPAIASHALARSADELLLSAPGAVQVFELESDGDLVPQPALPVAGAQASSPLAADRDTLAVASDLGVRVFQRH